MSRGKTYNSFDSREMAEAFANEILKDIEEWK
jgi:viroplasmin and RNaseH domain-containing protein